MKNSIRSLALAASFAAALSASPIAWAQTLMLSRTMDCTWWANNRNTPLAKTTVDAFMSALSISYWERYTAKVGEHGLDPIAALSSPAEAYGWIDGYCARNSDDYLTFAMRALFAELESRRRLAVK